MMHPETLTRQYEEALTLAESGRYEQALDKMLGYLKAAPADGKALNDAGTILFCMQRGREAIAYFEKALGVCRGDERTQVYWNLCEAYIQEDMPARAAELFHPMQVHGILNADILNRTAEGFLRKQDLGGAVETLLLSLSLYPNQEVLTPMLEVIRKCRLKVTVFADTETPLIHSLQASLASRVPVEVIISPQPQVISQRQLVSGLVIYAGAGSSLLHGLSVAKTAGIVAALTESDLYGPASQIPWQNADMILACASAEAIEDFKERTGARNVTPASFAPQAQPQPAQEKKAGKRLAAIGPWTLRHNPMFLLQCFQKLHYLDADTRLHLAGEFQDPGLERYIRTTAEAMDLDTVVFFDGPVKNLGKWLRDKHFIVSTAIDASAMPGVWTAMACGLKPIVHRFAGAESMIASEYVFTLAEQFCGQVQAAGFEPAVYRRMAQEQFESNGAARKIHGFLCRLEQAGNQTPQIQTLPASSISPAPVFETPAIPAQPIAAAGLPISTIAEQALSAAKGLRLIMDQSNPLKSSEPAAASSHSVPAAAPAQNPVQCNPLYQGLSVEPFLEAEPSAVPFAQAT